MARNGHGHADASLPCASCSSVNVAFVGVVACTVHARCQPTPWMACGLAPKFLANDIRRPWNVRHASRIRLEYGTSGYELVRRTFALANTSSGVERKIARLPNVKALTEPPRPG